MDFTGIIFSQDKAEMIAEQGDSNLLYYFDDIVYKRNGTFKTAGFNYNEETNPFQIKMYSKSNPDIWVLHKVIGQSSYDCLNDPSTKIAFGMIRTNQKLPDDSGNFYVKMYTEKPASDYDFGQYYESCTGFKQSMRSPEYLPTKTGESIKNCGFAWSRFDDGAQSAVFKTVTDWVLELPFPLFTVNNANKSGGQEWTYGMPFNAAVCFYTTNFLTQWDRLQDINDSTFFGYANKSAYFSYNPYEKSTEYDFYYRSRYGAEFPWADVPVVPTDIEITQLESHANSPNNPSKNIGSGISTVYGSVSFINLGTGFNYKVAVLAHDRISGDLVGDGGAVTFTASATTMTVDVGLPIDAKDRDGHKLVLYAYLWVVGEDIPVCEHVEELDEHAFIYIGSSADDEEPEEQEPDYSGMAVDENFNNLGPIENYNSLIWTDRYSKCGDFEIYTPVDMNLFNTLGVDSYLMIPESDRYMIVEKVEIISNATDGNKMCISGRSLESILDRRIIWHKTIIDEDLEGGNTVQNAIKKLITDNIISPPNLEYRRKIPNFIFRDCATDISDLKLTGEYLGDSLYDVICNVCENNNLGFRITIEPVEGKPSFIFQLYQGKNRSFDSSDNVTRVIFSPDMGNMVDCDYIKTKEDYKNVCLVGGENAKSDDDSQIFSSWGSNEHDGISRRELYLSASDLTKKVEGSDGKTKTLSDDEYKSVLQQRGHEELAEHKSVVSIDGTMCNKMFYYGENKDYYLGDIIECEDLYGNHAKSRITEVIISKNTSSYTIYPTFEAVTSEDLSIKIIYATAETFKDDAPQPLTQNKLNTEYFTYDTETCRYTCVKECNIDIYFSWKCKDVPKTKYKSLMRVKVNSLIDPDGCYHYWEVTQGTSGHKAFDNLHCAVGAQFWFEKEEHGNAYINEFTASIHIDDPT